MRLLLDTHVFLWLMGEPERLSSEALTACADQQNSLFLSVASLWEIQIKAQRGKLELDAPLEQMVGEQTVDGRFLLLPIEAAHVLALDSLALHHHDPFDRILIGQAKTEDMHLVTADQQIRRYASDVRLLW